MAAPLVADALLDVDCSGFCARLVHALIPSVRPLSSSSKRWTAQPPQAAAAVARGARERGRERGRAHRRRRCKMRSGRSSLTRTTAPRNTSPPTPQDRVVGDYRYCRHYPPRPRADASPPCRQCRRPAPPSAAQRPAPPSPPPPPSPSSSALRLRLSDHHHHHPRYRCHHPRPRPRHRHRYRRWSHGAVASPPDPSPMPPLSLPPPSSRLPSSPSPPQPISCATKTILHPYIHAP
jgi:hypothetical protein